MMSEEITKMMEQYAATAVTLGRDQFGIDLDFSEDSVQEVERILNDLADIAAREKPSGEAMDEMSKVWGGYLGEVVRKRWGGDWMIDYYPGGKFLIVALNVNGSRLFPSMKVNRRLTKGGDDNVWEFFQLLRTKLGAPGLRVQ